MAVGGFDGTDPWPTLAVLGDWLAKAVSTARGQGSQSFGGGRGSSSIESWVTAHFKKLTVGRQPRLRPHPADVVKPSIVSGPGNSRPDPG